MVELKNNGKLNFVVNVHYEYKEVMTGGIVAMHYLSYLLAKRGHNVYMFTTPEYPHENIHSIKSWRKSSFMESATKEGENRSWERFSYDVNNTIGVYSQDTYENPFNTKHVARWMLYNPLPHIVETWGENDKYFTYGDQKGLQGKLKNIQGSLVAMDFRLDQFKNENRKNRKGFCHLLHKHSSPNCKKFTSELNSTNLSNWKELGAFDYMVDSFNQHEYFITYDQLSFWPQVAALCGCKVVVMNTPDNPQAYYPYSTTPEQYREENPLKKYGVAFGFEDLQWALDTKHLVKCHLEEMNRQNEETVDNFIRFWENQCNL